MPSSWRFVSSISSVSWGPREIDVVTTLALNVLGRGVRIHCADQTSGALLSAAYGAMRSEVGAADLEYTVSRVAAATSGFVIERSGASPIEAPDDGRLLALFDADLAIEIQRLRPDLYVVHAAVLTHGDGAVMLVARRRKSTLSWALSCIMGWISDELAHSPPSRPFRPARR